MYPKKIFAKVQSFSSLFFGFHSIFACILSDIFICIVFFCYCPLICSIIHVFNPLISVDFIGGFDPFPLYHVNEKSSHLLLKPMYP